MADLMHLRRNSGPIVMTCRPLGDGLYTSMDWV
jgi:hypothetical protein